MTLANTGPSNVRPSANVREPDLVEQHPTSDEWGDCIEDWKE
jgi:hypothetical protein